MDGTYIVHSKKFYKNPTFQVLMAILLGGLFGNFYPDYAIEMKPLGDGFIRLIEWKTEGDASHRTVLEEKSLSELAKKL